MAAQAAALQDAPELVQLVERRRRHALGCRLATLFARGARGWSGSADGLDTRQVAWW
jgi:hypothetical protein